MKKYFILALFCAFIAGALSAQTVECTDCTHVAPVFMGEGGFIAMADDADEVVWVVTCGSVTMHGEMEPDDDGIVSGLFSMDNGLACYDDDGGSFMIGPVTDGGWYWITGDRSSAVGNLVDKNVLDNEAIEVVSAGDGVTMTDTKGAVLLTETATGRTGILPTVLAEPPMAAADLCGANDRGSTGTSATATAEATNARYTRKLNECMLGDGGTITLATIEDTFSGSTHRIMDKGTVTRPAGTGSVEVTVDLWGNGTGHFTTAATGVHALLGNPAVAMTGLRSTARLTGVTYRATLGSGPTADPLVEDAAAVGGVAMTDSDTNVVTFTITRDTAYCNASPPRNTSVAVSVTALITDSATNAGQITPPVALSRDSVAGNPVQVAGGTSFTIVCPSGAAAHQGTNLVPENPFPTDE